MVNSELVGLGAWKGAPHLEVQSELGSIFGTQQPVLPPHSKQTISEPSVPVAPVRGTPWVQKEDH